MKKSGLLKGIIWLMVTYIYAAAVGGHLSYFILYVTIGVLAISFCWSRLLSRITVSASLNTERSEVGNTVVMKVMIKNHSSIYLPWLWFNMALPFAFDPDNQKVFFIVSLKPNELMELNIPLECRVRGYFEWGKTELKSGDIFGIFSSHKTCDIKINLLIRPKAIYLGRNYFSHLDSMRNRANSAHPGRQISEFRGVREYVSGDPLGRIHWKASVKAQKFLVKEYEKNSLGEILLFLDLSSPPDRNAIERSIELIASLALTAIQDRLNVGLAVQSDKPKFIPPGRTKGQLGLILDLLAKVNGGEGEDIPDTILKASLSLQRGAKVILVTPNLSGKTLEILKKFTIKNYRVAVSLVQHGYLKESEFDTKQRNNVTGFNNFDIPMRLVDKNTNLYQVFGGIEHEAG